MNKIIFTLMILDALANSNGQLHYRAGTTKANESGIYHETYGEGPPLLLLHGYFQTSKAWTPFVKDLSKRFKVYLIDLPGHGQSGRFEQPLSLPSIAKELDDFAKSLQLASIRAIGFSFGGDILYQWSLLNPDLITSMITIGAVGTWSVHDFPQYLSQFTYGNRRAFPELLAEHRSTEQLKTLFLEFRNYETRLSNGELELLAPDILFVSGDDDPGMDFKEIARLKEFVPNLDIWILPDTTHSAHLGKNREVFLERALAFFYKTSN